MRSGPAHRQLALSASLHAGWRIARALLHVLSGLIVLRFRFPGLSPTARRRAIRRWSVQLLRIMGLRVRCRGELPRDHAPLLVAVNHVSWIDIFALLAHLPLVFVAKSEIRDWPVLGRLVAGAGTVFIERGRTRHAREAYARIAQVMTAGGMIGVFPEGTTTLGDRLLPFHAALFQPVIAAAGQVQPIALRYCLPDGRMTTLAAYVEGISLLGSVWQIARADGLVVELQLGALISATQGERRDLAHQAERAIASALQLPAPHRAHRIKPDPTA